MRYSIHAALLLAVFIRPAGAGDKGNKKKDKYQAAPADYDSLVQAGQAVGKLSNLDGTDHTFTLQIQYQYLTATAKGKTNPEVKKLVRQQAQVLKTTDPIKRLERLDKLILQAQRMQLTGKGNRNLFKVTTGRKDFNLRTIDDVKIRTMQLPVEYDDQGKVKKYTAKELKELKGKDPNLPGYTAAWDQVADGQTVKVTLLPKKKKKDTQKDAAKDKDAKDKAAAEADDDYRPQVKMLVIMKEPPPDTSNSGKKGKAK
jgi:hypothetical protein